MRNELLHVGPFTVYGYGFMIALGILTGWALAQYRSRRQGLDQEFLLSFIFWAVIGGFGGAKLMFWIVNLPQIVREPSFFVDTLLDGFVVMGGLFLGILTAWLFCRKRGEPFLPWFDFLMPEVGIAQAFGRLGCFLAGCCYGKETTGPFYVEFSESVYAPNHVHLVPTQLISSGLNLANALICLAVSGKVRSGQVAALYLMNYSFGRFFLEFWRGDLERGFIGPLSTSQALSCILFGAGLLLWIFGPRLSLIGGKKS